jgi:pentatricopeptide repeat protein
MKVRQDFFDGIRGDAAALDRAQKLCEDTLAKDPDHAEALVWHGAALAARSQLHSREQLLYGLTNGYAMLGQTDKARATYERMRHDAAGSELLPRAAERAAGHAVAGDAPCEQCHAR